MVLARIKALKTTYGLKVSGKTTPTLKITSLHTEVKLQHRLNFLARAVGLFLYVLNI